MLHTCNGIDVLLLCFCIMLYIVKYIYFNTCGIYFMWTVDTVYTVSIASA